MSNFLIFIDNFKIKLKLWLIGNKSVYYITADLDGGKKKKKKKKAWATKKKIKHRVKNNI